MSSAFSLLEQAPGGQVDQSWFNDISELLLNETVFHIAGQPHRFCEVEFYYKGDEHPDPFTHGDPIQLTKRRWYFHRDEGGYRGGSFKGLDISFGREEAYGGVLIRTLEKPDGSLVNGCSLCVDHMLSLTGESSVADLDKAINARDVADSSSPLYITHDSSLESRDIARTARVGLTLKRAYKHKEMPAYIMRPYRSMTRPGEIKKGRLHYAVALHVAGDDVETIHKKSRSPRKSIKGYVEAFSEGQDMESFKAFYGKSLKTADLCKLHGLWQREYGS